MYAGQIVMKQYCDQYGLQWNAWPPAAFESVQHRHEALVAAVRMHITPDVPDGAFFPLGIKSQLLLTGERVAVDEDALAEMQVRSRRATSYCASAVAEDHAMHWVLLL